MSFRTFVSVVSVLALLILPSIAMADCWEQLIKSCCTAVDNGQPPQLNGVKVGDKCTVDSDCADFIIASPNVYQVRLAASGQQSHQPSGNSLICKYEIVLCIAGHCTKSGTTVSVPCHNEVLSGATCP